MPAGGRTIGVIYTRAGANRHAPFYRLGARKIERGDDQVRPRNDPVVNHKTLKIRYSVANGHCTNQQEEQNFSRCCSEDPFLADPLRQVPRV